MRIFGVLCPYTVVSRAETHDLLIRGPFSDGSTKRRLINQGLRWQKQLLGHAQPVTLHVSSENPFAENYQGFDQSGCDFGLGHEIRIGDARYHRMPHWWNYVDFSAEGVPSPERWVRLGPVDGFGRAFDGDIADHTRSGFTKRELLKEYQFCFCPENAIAPGYYTEKVPESFACGSIPIAYVDAHASIDFNPRSFLNVYDYLSEGVSVGLEHDLLSEQRMLELTTTPLLRERIRLDLLIDFVKGVIVESTAD